MSLGECSPLVRSPRVSLSLSFTLNFTRLSNVSTDTVELVLLGNVVS